MIGRSHLEHDERFIPLPRRGLDCSDRPPLGGIAKRHVMDPANDEGQIFFTRVNRAEEAPRGPGLLNEVTRHRDMVEPSGAGTPRCPVLSLDRLGNLR